ncbi:hypothetical protein HDE_13135 [Halotydeus destructor]|nr:hypothetical protein HDE_13135 [Halotydeus destructor]
MGMEAPGQVVKPTQNGHYRAGPLTANATQESNGKISQTPVVSKATGSQRGGRHGCLSVCPVNMVKGSYVNMTMVLLYTILVGCLLSASHVQSSPVGSGRCFTLCRRSESNELCRGCRYREPMRFGKRIPSEPFDPSVRGSLEQVDREEDNSRLSALSAESLAHEDMPISQVNDNVLQTSGQRDRALAKWLNYMRRIVRTRKQLLGD